MIRASKTIGSQMAKLYIKRYSSSSKELNKNIIHKLNESRNNSSLTKKENIELIEVRSQANSEDYNSMQKSLSGLELNKLENETSKNSSSTNLIKSMNQPLLYDSSLQIININQNETSNSNIRYTVEKYDENCIDDSKIEYIECLLEEQNKNFFYFQL